MKPSWMFVKDLNVIGRSYLVMCDGISQFLNKSIQGFGVFNIE